MAVKGLKFRLGDFFFQHLIWFTSKLSDAHLLHLNIYCTIYSPYCGTPWMSLLAIELHYTHFQAINEAHPLSYHCKMLFCRALQNTGMVERVLLRPFNS